MMKGPIHDNRAISLLEDIKPELLKLLGGSPAFGSVGIDITFHDAEITRIVTRMEISRKPRIGEINTKGGGNGD